MSNKNDNSTEKKELPEWTKRFEIDIFDESSLSKLLIKTFIVN